MMVFQLSTHDTPNAYQDMVMVWLLLLLSNEPNTSFQVYMQCINQGNVLDNRQSYSKKKCWVSPGTQMAQQRKLLIQVSYSKLI